MSIELVMPSNHLIFCHPLLLQPSIFPSIRVFSNESVLCIRWPKYWNCSFSTSPSSEYSGLISFRIYWLDLPEVQATLKSLLKHHSSKVSILWHSAFLYGPALTSIHDHWKNHSPRILEWVAYPFSRASSQLRNQTGVSCIAGRFFTNWATREAHSFD